MRQSFDGLVVQIDGTEQEKVARKAAPLRRCQCVNWSWKWDWGLSQKQRAWGLQVVLLLWVKVDMHCFGGALLAWTALLL